MLRTVDIDAKHYIQSNDGHNIVPKTVKKTLAVDTRTDAKSDNVVLVKKVEFNTVTNEISDPRSKGTAESHANNEPLVMYTGRYDLLNIKNVVLIFILLGMFILISITLGGSSGKQR
jgi:hypothetical protein